MINIEKVNNNVTNFQMDLKDIIKNQFSMTYDYYLECTDDTFNILYYYADNRKNFPVFKGIIV